MLVKIGGITLENPLFMAPLSGYCDSPYRRLARSFGCALTYSGLISSHALVYGNRATMELLRHEPEEKPIALQIFGNDPGLIAEGAAILESAGADIIDLNAGCGVPKVFKAGSGMALCKDLHLLEKILKILVRAVSVPVILKTRIGFNPREVTVLEAARVAESAGVSAIAVHPRYHSQRFSGKADHTWAEKIQKVTNLPIIGSGDLNTPGEVLEALTDFGYDAVMLGRGGLGNPRLFSRSLALLKDGIEPPPPTVNERLKTAIHHLDLIEQFYPPRRSVLFGKLHISHYLHGIYGASRFRDMLHRASATGEIRDLLNNIISGLSENVVA